MAARHRASSAHRNFQLLTLPFQWLAGLSDIVFSLPGLGRLLRWVWSLALTLLHLVGGMLEYGLIKLGFFPVKRMQLGVVILRDETGEPVSAPAALLPDIQKAIDLLYQKARVRLVPVPPIAYDLDEHGCCIAAEDWVFTDPRPAHKAMLDVHCNNLALREDLWITGALYQLLTLRVFIHTSVRRLLGYGAPVIAIVVRDLDRHGGCSIGPLTDYVTIAKYAGYCLAHELGHACSLPHYAKDADNLMDPTCGKSELTEWQVALLRASRHVSFF
jgi:hypothetical protein